MDKVENFISKHLAWIASIVIAVGFYIAVIQGQSVAIETLKSEVKEQHNQISQIEKCIIKLDTIEKSLEEVKTDLKQIKGILYKPIVSSLNSEQPENNI